MFGSEPPQALYQITTVVENNNRDSVATILSISSTDLLSVHTSRAGKHRSFSSMSVSSVPSEGSLPTTAADPPAPSPLEAPRSHRRTPSVPPPFQEITYSQDGHSDGHASSRPSTSNDVEDTEAFRLRRRRAAKLSHFFGVDVHDLTKSIDPAPPPLPPTPQGRQIPETQTVDVRIHNGKFWSRRDGREMDMNDAISRLREMR